MAMSKPKPHKEWFRSVSQKMCDCGASAFRLRKLGKLEQARAFQVYAWGEYCYGKWRTIKKVCANCQDGLYHQLQAHLDACGCSFEFTMYRGAEKPVWLKELEARLAGGAKSAGRMVDLLRNEHGWTYQAILNVCGVSRETFDGLMYEAEE